VSAKTMITSHGQTVSITRPTTAADNGGFPNATYAAHLSSVRMWIQPRSGSESPRYGGEQTQRSLVGYALAGQSILPKDRVTWGARVFDIQSVRQPAEFNASKGGYMIFDLEERAATLPAGSA